MAFLLIIGIILVLALSTMWSGFILSILWGWFIVPIFGLPTLSVTAAIGVALTFGYFIRGLATAHVDKEKTGELIISAFTTSLIFLFIGWIVKSFM